MWDCLSHGGIFFNFHFNASLARSSPVRNHVSTDLQSTGPVVLIALLCNHTWIIYRLASHWWTDVVPYQQHISYATKPHHRFHCLYPWFSIHVPLMYYAGRLTPHPSEIWTSNLSFLNPPIHVSHICLLTPRAFDVTQIVGHMCCAEIWPQLVWLGMAFIYSPECLPV